MTHKEHEAAAMLLGENWRYNYKGHYYWTLGFMDTRQYIDADTGEPLTQHHAWERGEDEYGYKVKP